MRKEMTFREMLGQRLFINVLGTGITPELRRLVKEYKCGNIVLFQPNIVSIEQMRRFCQEFQALVMEELGIPARNGLAMLCAQAASAGESLPSASPSSQEARASSYFCWSI